MFPYEVDINAILNLVDVKVKQSDCLSGDASHLLMLL